MSSVVAIDGPACSGKGTLARKIAEHFQFIYLDTGMLYRIIAYLNKPLEELCNLSVFDVIKFSQKFNNNVLRSEENGIRASNLAKDPQIRELMLKMQRDFVNYHSKEFCVLDGRDIGTVVFPDAFCKLFITADLETRAKRHFQDLKKVNEHIKYNDIFADIKRRDEQDIKRDIAPLHYDNSYHLIDTTKQSIEEALGCCISVISSLL